MAQDMVREMNRSSSLNSFDLSLMHSGLVRDLKTINP